MRARVCGFASSEASWRGVDGLAIVDAWGGLASRAMALASGGCQSSASCVRGEEAAGSASGDVRQATIGLKARSREPRRFVNLGGISTAANAGAGNGAGGGAAVGAVTGAGIDAGVGSCGVPAPGEPGCEV